MTPWAVILGAFAGSLAGAVIAVVAVYLVVGYFSRRHHYTAVSPEILEKIEAAKRKYGIPDYGLDEETLELGLDPEE